MAILCDRLAARFYNSQMGFQENFRLLDTVSIGLSLIHAVGFSPVSRTPQEKPETV